MLKNKRFLNWGIVFLLIILPGCNNNIPPDKSFDVISYRDIPGVTAEEINAIEALKVQYDYFIYGMLECTESFYNMDGNIDGFTRLVCDWLTDIFGIPFIPRNYIWTDLLDGLRDGTIDFSGYLMPTPGRRETYNMTDPIAQRMVKYYRLRDSAPLSEIRETRLPKYALVTDAASTHTVLQYAAYEFEPVYVEVYTDAYELMINGDVDALITVGVLETGFGNDVMTEDFMPPIFASTSFAAQNPAFQPFIGVVQKALENGAIHYFHELYRQGYREYMRHTLLSWLNEEESVFLKTNPVISLIGERDNYPLSFFNTRYQEWQGIAFDVLREVNLLTGLEYKVINEPSAEWHELLIMLEDGDASMVTHLARTKERENRFLWPGSVFFTDQPVLISKNEFPNISISEVFLVKVGLVRDSVHDELFRTWFPEHNNMFTYDSMGESFAALIRGEIDMVMNTQSGLLYLTNFQELAGYKANIIFNNSLSITFGLNRDEPILLSIIDKSMQLIDTEMISGQWLRRTYDYRLKLVQAQRPWLVGAVITLAVILILLMIIFLNDRLKRKIIADKAAAEMASRAKSEFLATMSHEIRTPMNSIMGFAELATDSESVSETRDYLGKITDSTKWLLHIINDILDISKIESGKMELEKVPFDLRDVFSRCQSVILPSVKEKGLDLSIYAEPSIGKKLLGDPLRLYQVLMNLLSNAVKFTNAGTVKFSSAIKNTENGFTTVYFEIKDSGIGMDPAQVKKVFDPFIQADSSTTRDYGGTGLGLAIAKNIVEMMGGKLAVESSPGLGSTFSFEIVFETKDSPDETPEREYFDMPEKPYFDGLVLICDDNSMNQEVICAHLTRVGLQSMTADNGKMGVEMVEERIKENKKPFDIIFMDMFMPVMDGMEAAAKIMALNTGTPIVAMTANIMVSELEKYKKAGMPDCLGKPFTSQELWRILLHYLKPISNESLSSALDDQFVSNELQRKLQIYFVKNNQTVYAKIMDAVAAGDIKQAHRLAHSLKGNAGMIGKTALASAAADVEERLKSWDSSAWDSKINNLKTELELVLDELEPLLDQAAAQEARQGSLLPVLDAAQIHALFEKLEPMLKNINPECTALLDEIRAIPGAQDLAQQIENFDFESAASELAELKRKIEN